MTNDEENDEANKAVLFVLMLVIVIVIDEGDWAQRSEDKNVEHRTSNVEFCVHLWLSGLTAR